jgi:CheY-like chemotaxis protein
MISPVSERKISKFEGLSGKKVLVVDEDDFVRDLITKILTRYLGLEVFLARSGSEAISAALTGQYDVAIIDLAMPHTSGVKIIQTIKTTMPDFPIIAMASCVDGSAINSVRRFGINEVLPKPFKMTALIEGITEILNNNRILSI